VPPCTGRRQAQPDKSKDAIQTPLRLRAKRRRLQRWQARQANGNDSCNLARLVQFGRSVEFGALAAAYLTRL
jgi:hypothetical protein